MPLKHLTHTVDALLAEYRFAKYIAKVCKEMRGTTRRRCPICRYDGYFLAFGIPPRFDACCPQCSSLERHRLLFLCDLAMHLFTADIEVLHFAPEPSVTAFVAPRVKRCRSADIVAGKGELQLNIEELRLPDASVDLVLASHIFEHVDDAKALREIRRVLKPGGRAVLMFPLVEGWETTYENPQIVDNAERVLHFGQCDHVRYYGRDVRNRITAAGFQLDEYCGSASDCLTYGLQRGERVFIAGKV